MGAGKLIIRILLVPRTYFRAEMPCGFSNPQLAPSGFKIPGIHKIKEFQYPTKTRTPILFTDHEITAYSQMK